LREIQQCIVVDSRHMKVSLQSATLCVALQSAGQRRRLGMRQAPRNRVREMTPAATVPSPTSSLEEFGEAYVAAWNSHDADRLLEFMAPDIVYDDSTWPTTMHGHNDVREFLRAAWRAFPDMRFQLLEGPYRLGDNKAAFWWRGDGTFSGPLEPPGFAPTGKSWQIDGVDFHEYRDGRISRLAIMFNLADASQQVGLMPSSGSRGERLWVTLQRLTTRFARRWR
jgi:steroid delta-isomerase-like uncharacterized protein